jgi:hypothetical protein
LDPDPNWIRIQAYKNKGKKIRVFEEPSEGLEASPEAVTSFLDVYAGTYCNLCIFSYIFSQKSKVWN